MSMRKILRNVAKENGVTLKEVRVDMQAALTSAYTGSPNNNGVIKAYQNRVPRKGEVPTPEEFIRYATKVANDKLTKD